MIDQYSAVAPKSDMALLHRLGAALRRRKFLHVSSTRAGGGVAEILQRMVPVLNELEIDTRWEVITGDARFFETTKKIHNSLQGEPEEITPGMWEHHSEVNTRNAERLDLEADAVLIHDPQPMPLVRFRKSGTWFWRCHIDISHSRPETWEPVRKFCEQYDGAVFSAPKFAKPVRLNEFIVAPSIDPFSEKNRDLSPAEIRETAERFAITPDRPVLLQVSRFDRFKDPIGVIRAYRMVKKYNDCMLVLAGSPATDDPEGAQVLNEVQQYAADDPDIRILLLPPFSDLHINALQRLATVVIQKSLKEGFGLTVAEAMWKGKPVIGGAAGGIPLQIVHGVTGFLVHSVEGAAFRIRQFLNNPEMGRRIGERAREFVRGNFLITRQMRDYLAVWYTLERNGRRTIEFR